MRFIRHLGIAMLAAISFSCCDEQDGESINDRHFVDFITLDAGVPTTKSDLPNEDVVTDINLFILNSAGALEDKLYFLRDEIVESQGTYSCPVRLLYGESYTIYAMANLGYQPDLNAADEIESFRYYLSRPDDFRIGIPMSGMLKNVTIGEDGVRIILYRAMSKVTVRMDTSELDDSVSINVTAVRVGNCPKAVALFEESGAGSEDEIFATGFARPSLPDSFFLCENCQPAGSALSSYIEMEASYSSPSMYTKSDKHLIYRFYIGGEDTPTVERNCHYTITVRPKGDGLGGVDVSDWRIDKSELSVRYDGDPYIIPHPSNYIECKRGDVLHVWCEVYPPDTDFDVGLEELESDREDGIYDYVIDDDGHGVVLTMKKKGTGLLYMSAGEPVWEDEMFIIVCEP